MAECSMESGFQFLRRLNVRPTLENIYPPLFSNNGPFGKQVVEIIGETSTGKTCLVTEIVAKCILPESINDISVGGKNCGAIFINTDHHFHIFILINVMEEIVKKCTKNKSTLTSKQIENIIKLSLENLIILNCFDGQQLYITFYNMENILSTNNAISLIVLDSISAYYWSDRENKGMIKKELHHKSILKMLQSKIKEYNITLMFTKPISFLSKDETLEDCSISSSLGKINYRISLHKLQNDETYFANVTLPNNTNLIKHYKINKIMDWL